jgi:hypothetical protein
MENMIGNKTWFIADGFLPDKSSGLYPSHESICVLNIGNQDAKIKITCYFEDREPIENLTAVCKAKRTNHIRLDKIKDANGNLLPRGLPYAIQVDSNNPVIVQHTRLDTSQPELALMTTMAYEYK